MITDLNLLRIFDVVLEERSVTRAGARLGLTQSAVSHALNRLRYTLNDELFVRGPTGMNPTPRALEMGPQVHAALTQLQTAIDPGGFDPASSDRRFTIAAGAYACAVFGPPLMARLREAAPFAELSITDRTPDLMDRIDARQVDFMISSLVAGPDRLAKEPLISEALAWVARAGSPLSMKNRVDLEDLVETPHVVISRDGARDEGLPGRGLTTRASWDDAGALDVALAAKGLKRRVGVTVPDTYSALAIAIRSDMPALAPKRLVMMAAQSGRVALIEPPYASPNVEISLIFLRDRLNDPAIVWMRDQLRAVAAEL
jgi:DNA-binding transcriptional LysR family regulator